VRGGDASHQPRCESGQLVGLAGVVSGRGVNKKRARTLNSLPYQHCICCQSRFAETLLTPVTDMSTKLYTTYGPTWQRMTCSLFGTACDEPGTTAVCLSGLDKTRVHGRDPARFVIWHRCSFHCRCTSQGPPPNHSCAVWCLLHSRIKFRVLDESWDLKFSYREIHKPSCCWETVWRESMPRIAETNVEMTT